MDQKDVLDDTTDSVRSNDSITDEKNDEVCLEKLSMAVAKLDSDSTKSVFKTLNYLRTRILDRSSGVEIFFEMGGIKPFYKILTTSHEEILNLALSILGNCCVTLIINDAFCEDVSRNELPAKLSSILKRTTNVKIQRRVCRIVGNLAQSHSLARELVKVNMPSQLTSLLSSSQCPELQQMIVRAIRWLWETDKYVLLKNSAIKAVATLLQTENEQLLKQVLRTLVTFTQPCNGLAAKQICGDGDGYSLILSKINLTVVRVLISNLSHCPDARIELSRAGVVDKIVNILEEEKIDSYLVTALCMLCREPMARASLRLSPSGFKTVLALLMNPKARHFYPDLLNAIAQFVYDKPSLMLMVKGGLINVLIERLNEFTSSHGSPHTDNSLPMTAPMSPTSPTSSWGSQSPPPQTPLSDSVMYSPRCTTPEDDLSDASTSKSCFDKYHEICSGIDGCILEVLLQLSYQSNPLHALASKTTIITFLEYMTGLRYPQSRSNFIRAANALGSIVKCKHYFNALLDEESILAIDRFLCRGSHTDCWECRRLEGVGRSVLLDLGTAAQSGLGVGELVYRLATSSDSVKSTVSLSIPYIIRQPNLLNSLLFGHKALNVILGCLKTRAVEAVPSLHNLFVTLSIQNPQAQIQMCNTCDVSSLRRESNISFRLDDGSLVMANRESLSHSCPMFEAMFRGGFVEASQSTVHITDMSPSCLTHLTRIIDEYCTCALPKDLDVLLEMITASDRFLLPELSQKVLTVVMNSTLSHSTSPDIYEWSVDKGSRLSLAADVPTDVVKYLMVSEMPAPSRVLAVQNIMNSAVADYFLQHITSVVETGLKASLEETCLRNYLVCSVSADMKSNYPHRSSYRQVRHAGSRYRTNPYLSLICSFNSGN